MIITRRFVLGSILYLIVSGCFGTSMAETVHVYKPIFSSRSPIEFIKKNGNMYEKIGGGHSVFLSKDCDIEGFKCLGTMGLRYAVPISGELSKKTWFVNETEFWVDDEVIRKIEGVEKTFYIIGSLWKPSKEYLEAVRKDTLKIIQNMHRELNDEGFKGIEEGEEKETWRKYFLGRIKDAECDLEHIGEYLPRYFSYNTEIGIDYIISFPVRYDDNCNLITHRPPHIYRLEGSRGILAQ